MYSIRTSRVASPLICGIDVLSRIKTAEIASISLVAAIKWLSSKLAASLSLNLRNIYNHQIQNP
jgi:hypothetical protein